MFPSVFGIKGEKTMKKTVKTLASVMSAVLLMSVCSCNKADTKKAVDPIIGLMEDSVGKDVDDAEKMFEKYFGVELEGKPGVGSGGDTPLRGCYYDSILTKDGVTFTSLSFLVVIDDNTVQQVQLFSDNVDADTHEYDISSERVSEIKGLSKAMNKALEDKTGKPDYSAPIFEGSKESYSNRYKTNDFYYVVSVRDVNDVPEWNERENHLVDTSILVFKNNH